MYYTICFFFFLYFSIVWRKTSIIVGFLFLKKKIVYDGLGDFMNTLEIMVVLNRMIQKTKTIERELMIRGLIIDKKEN